MGTKSIPKANWCQMIPSLGREHFWFQDLQWKTYIRPPPTCLDSIWKSSAGHRPSFPAAAKLLTLRTFAHNFPTFWSLICQISPNSMHTFMMHVCPSSSYPTYVLHNFWHKNIFLPKQSLHTKHVYCVSSRYSNSLKVQVTKAIAFSEQ